MAYFDAIEFAFRWLRDRTAWKYLAALFAVALISGIAELLLGKPPTSIEEIMRGESGMPATPLGAAAVLLMGVATILIAFYISALLKIRALKVAGHSPPEFGVSKFVKLIATVIAAFIFAVFSVYRLKWLVLGIAGTVLLIAGILLLFVNPIVGILLLGVSGILLAAYFVAVVYNSLRLMFSDVCLLNSNAGISECLKNSETLTKGKVIGLFLASLVFAIIILVVMVPAALAVMGIQIVALLSGVLAFSGIAILLNALVTAVLSAMGNFFEVGLFDLAGKGESDKKAKA